MKNENKLDEMVDIMDELGKYVPCSTTQRKVCIEGLEPEEQTLTSLHQLLFGGDQLTAARARGAIRQRQNSLTAMERLEGFVPVAEDWHAKVCLITVKDGARAHECGIDVQSQCPINYWWGVAHKRWHACTKFTVT